MTAARRAARSSRDASCMVSADAGVDASRREFATSRKQFCEARVVVAPYSTFKTGRGRQAHPVTSVRTGMILPVPDWVGAEE